MKEVKSAITVDGRENSFSRQPLNGRFAEINN
jgi:hypothetical protein